MTAPAKRPTHFHLQRYGAVIIATTVSALLAGPTAIAQQQLPGIVVQGATIEAKPVRRTPAPEDEAPPQPPAGPAQKAAPKPPAPQTTLPPVATNLPPPAETTGLAGQGPAIDRNETTGGIPLERIGTSVQVVTGEELRQRQIRNGADALRALAGVSVSRTGNVAGQTVVRLRGGESRHTLVLIDGQEVNAVGNDNIYDFANLAVEDIERIEVLRGPQSGLYGSGALSGAINIVTKSGRGPLTIQARAEVGSFRTREAAVSVSGGTDRLHGIMTLYGRRSAGFDVGVVPGTGGFTDKDFANAANFSFAGGFKVFDNLKIDGALRHSSIEGGRDGFSGDLGGLTVAQNERSTFASDIWLGRVSATLDTFSDGRWVQKLSGGRVTTRVSDTDRGLFAVDPIGGDYTQQTSMTTKYGYTSTVRLDFPGATRVRHFVTGQIERQNESFEQPTNTLGAKRERSTIGTIGELRGEYFNTLFLSGVVRRDNNDAFDDFTSWRTTASLKVPSTIFRLHGSMGTGVKYPSFSQLYGFFSGFKANSGLKPEQSFGWDGGIEATFLGGVAVLDVTYFNQDLKNEIDFAGGFDPLTGQFFFQPFNRTGKSTREGLEVTGRARVTQDLTVGASYTYLLAREFNATTGVYDQEIRRAPHSGRVDANYAFSGGLGNFNLAVAYNGRMLDRAYPSNFSDPFLLGLKEYWLVTAATSYKVMPGVEVFGRLENALNQKYQEVFGYNTAGIAGFAGMRFTFEDASTRDWAKYK